MAYIHCSVMTLKAYNSNNRKKNLSLLAEFVTTFNLMLSNHGTFFMQQQPNFASQGSKNCGGSQKNPGFQGFQKIFCWISCEKTFACFCQSIGGMGIIIMFFQLSTISREEKWPKSKNKEKIFQFNCSESGLGSLTPP